jgi:DNA-binding response OmpR family regulator
LYLEFLIAIVAFTFYFDSVFATDLPAPPLGDGPNASSDQIPAKPPVTIGVLTFKPGLLVEIAGHSISFQPPTYAVLAVIAEGRGEPLSLSRLLDRIAARMAGQRYSERTIRYLIAKINRNVQAYFPLWPLILNHRKRGWFLNATVPDMALSKASTEDDFANDEWGQIKFFPDYTAQVDDQIYHFSHAKRCYLLLGALVRARGDPVSYLALHHTYRPGYDPDHDPQGLSYLGRVRAHVLRLRRILAPSPHLTLINIEGFGYRLMLKKDEPIASPLNPSE